MNLSSLRRMALSTVSLASAVACLPAVAQSSVTLYGAVGLDVVSASKVYNGSTTQSLVKLDDNGIVNSRIGLKGTEDLGGGLKGVFGLESSISPDTGKTNPNAFWNRNAFVGLSGGLGTLKLGHQWNVADDYLCGYFVCAYYSPFLMNGFLALSDYYDNVIKYTSPNIGGFEGAVMHSLGEVSGKRSAGQKTQIALNYAAGPFGAALMGFSEKDKTGTGLTNTLYAGGLSYDFGVAKARLGLASAEVKYGTVYEGKVIDVGVDVPLTAAASVSADYVLNDKKASEDDTSFLRLRGSYALSKRTSLNSNLIFLKNSGNANFAFYSNTGTNFSGQAGQKQTVLTVGVTHAF
jgi:predicted porin